MHCNYSLVTYNIIRPNTLIRHTKKDTIKMSKEQMQISQADSVSRAKRAVFFHVYYQNEQELQQKMAHWLIWTPLADTTLSDLTFSSATKQPKKNPSIYRLHASPTERPSCRSRTVSLTDPGSVSGSHSQQQDWLRDWNICEGVSGWQNSSDEIKHSHGLITAGQVTLAHSRTWKNRQSVNKTRNIYSTR